MAYSDEIRSMILLNSLPSLNAARIYLLVETFGSAAGAVASGPTRWRDVKECSHWDIHNIERDWDGVRNESDREVLELGKKGFSVCLIGDKCYPSRLMEISSPPPLLYIRGHGWDFDRPAVAIVGSRRASYYGDRVARRFASELADLGIVTVSGLAKGIDRAVHEASVRSGEETWAVLGSGLSRLYPPDHEPLAKEIEKKGAIISEFPLESRPFPGNFPRRNRIISGMSQLTVVVEGSEKSGSLITARLAAYQGRDVLAVPGPITSPTSWAPNFLIKEGAKPVLDVKDIIEELRGLKPESGKSHIGNGPAAEDHESNQMLELLSSTPVPKEWLMTKLAMGPEAYSAAILDLELKGLIQSLPGGLLVRKG